MQYHDKGAGPLARFAGACVAALRRGFDSWMRNVHVNITYRALYRLDDRTLADIGLHRSSLRWQAQQVVDAARARHARAVTLAQLAGRDDFEAMPRRAANDAALPGRRAA